MRNFVNIFGIRSDNMAAHALLTAGSDEEFFAIIVTTIILVILVSGGLELYEKIREWKRNGGKNNG